MQVPLARLRTAEKSPILLCTENDRFRYSTLQRELPPIGGRLPSVSSPVLFLGKLLEKEGRCKKRSEDPDSDRAHNSLDRGGLPAPFQAQALKRPSLGPALLTQLPSSMEFSEIR